MLAWIVLGAAVGYVIATGSPKEYTVTMSMVSESTKVGGASMKALEALGLGSSMTSDDAYSPQFYNEIVKSKPFVVGLFNTEMQTSESDSTFTLRQIMQTKIKESWWSEKISSLKSKGNDSSEEEVYKYDEIIDPFNLTEKEEDVYASISVRINATVDNRTGRISISVTMQDPLLAAQMTDTVAAHLQEFITDYRTAKVRQDLDYAIGINEEAKEQYYDAQTRYAEWMDRNHALATYEAQSERDRLENDMQLAFNLFNATSQKVQTAEALVQSETPVFAVVTPASVPAYPSAPKKKLIVAMYTLIFTLIGTFFCCFTLFFSENFKAKVRHEADDYKHARKARRQAFLNKLRRFRKHKDEPDEDISIDVMVAEDKDKSTFYIREEEVIDRVKTKAENKDGTE